MGSASDAEDDSLTTMIPEDTPVGTLVIVHKDDGTDFPTTTRTRVLRVYKGGPLVVWVKGISGCYAASHITLAPRPGGAEEPPAPAGATIRKSNPTYAACPACHRWGFIDSHHCPPMWEAAIPDLTGYVDADAWTRVRATNAEGAAEETVKRWASDNGKYPDDGDEFPVFVRRVGEQTIRTFTVRTAMEIHFYGEEV